MTTAVIPTATTTASTDLIVAPDLTAEDRERVGAAIAASRSPGTRAAYASCWRAWAAWCRERGCRPLPASPAHLAAFFADRHADGLSNAWVNVARAAIAAAHVDAQLADPTKDPGVRKTVSGLRRLRPGSPRRVEALKGEDLERVLAALPSTARGRRDRAIVLVMRDSLLRRSEAATLVWADVEEASDGSGRLTIRRSKADQQGLGAVLWISPRAVEALREHGRRDPGASVFGLSPGAVSRAIARAAEAAGLSGRFRGHSLRRGTAQVLAEAGMGLPAIMAVGRWKSADTLSTYVAGAEASYSATARVFGSG